MQTQIFFPAEKDAPSNEFKQILVNPKTKSNPFCKYIGNEVAVKRLCRAAYSALGNKYHLCPQNFALIGPASTGKTSIANMFAKLLGLPFVSIDPLGISSVKDIWTQSKKVLEDSCINAGGKIILPPCVIFIDEVHALKKVVIEGLLKATEPNDKTMTLESGEQIDTSNVTWLIATTDRGALGDAFDTRFDKIKLNLYTKKEIEKIVSLNFPEFDEETCKLVAKFAGRVPREVLAFARETKLEQKMTGSTWEQAAKSVAADREIDEYGMTFQRIEILKALGEGPIAKSRLASVAQCKEEELVKFVMPELMANISDRKALVNVASRGYVITQEGLNELDKRGLSHKGVLALGKRL